MARRSYRRTARSGGRSYSARRSTRAPARRSYGRSRSTSRRTSSGGGSRTVRIVIEQPGMSPVARPEMIGVKPTFARASTRSRF